MVIIVDYMQHLFVFYVESSFLYMMVTFVK